MDKRLMPILAVAVGTAALLAVIPVTTKAKSDWPIFDTDPDQFCRINQPGLLEKWCPTIKKGDLVVTDSPHFYCDLSKPIHEQIEYRKSKISHLVHYCIYRGKPRRNAK